MQENPKEILTQKPIYLVRRRSPWPWIGAGIVFAVLLLLLLISIGVNVAFIKGKEKSRIIPSVHPRISEFSAGGSGENKIAIIPIEGFIGFSETGGGIWERENIVSEVSAALEKAEKDPAVKAVILKINSPGGGITASDVIYHRLREFKAVGKKIVALFGPLATSGAYYIACSSDLIIAHPTSVTGSFGVIIQFFNLEGLMKKIGVGDVTIKAGEQKDLLSPFRTLTAEERMLLQEVVDEMHDRFIEVIARGRNLDEAKTRELSDGRVFTATRARELKLVDEIGYETDAVDLARELAGLESARVVEYRSVKTFWDFLRTRARPVFPRSQLSDFRALFRPVSPRLLYLWSP
jgi:protease-4